MIKILYIEDKIEDQKIFKDHLQSGSIDNELTLKSSLQEGENAIRSNDYDIIFCDFKIGEHSAIELLSKKNLIEEIPVIVISSEANVQITRDSMKEGAFDFLPKGDLNTAILERIINSALRAKKEAKLRKI